MNLLLLQEAMKIYQMGDEGRTKKKRETPVAAWKRRGLGLHVDVQLAPIWGWRCWASNGEKTPAPNMGRVAAFVIFTNALGSVLSKGSIDPKENFSWATQCGRKVTGPNEAR